VRLSKDNRINDRANELVGLGWRVVQSRHVRLVSPNGRVKITVPRTPSDYRSSENWLHQTRRIIRAHECYK
jgi:integrase